MTQPTNLQLAQKIDANHLVMLDFFEQMRDFQGMVAARFTSVDTKFDEIDTKFVGVDARFDSIDSRFSEISESLGKHDTQFDGILNVLDAHTGKLNDIDLEVKSIGISLNDQDSRISLLEIKP